MGSGLVIISNKLFFFLFFSSTIVLSEKNSDSLSEKKINNEYYGYWNPYQRLLLNQNSKDFFIAQDHYKVIKNKKNKIKIVNKYNKNGELIDSWRLRWNRSGTRSEYNINFNQKGIITRVDSILFSHKLSEIKKGWKAKFISRKDGRPVKVDVYDNKNIRYYFYRFHYTQRRDSLLSVETIRSSYFRSDSSLVGRHLIFMKDGEWLKEIHYFNHNDSLIQIDKYDQNFELEELIKTSYDAKDKLISSRILQLSYPDQHSYFFEWKQDTIIYRSDRVLKVVEDTLKYISPVLGAGWYGSPLFFGEGLNGQNPHPAFGLFFSPRGNLKFLGKDLSFGIEMFSYKLSIIDKNEDIGGLAVMGSIQNDFKFKHKFIPKNLHLAMRFGAGMLSYGSGLSISALLGYNLLPTRLYVGIYGQGITSFNDIGDGLQTNWGTLGLVLGANIGELDPDLLIPYKSSFDDKKLINSLSKLLYKSSLSINMNYPVIKGDYIRTIYEESNNYSILFNLPFQLKILLFDFSPYLESISYNFYDNDSSRKDLSISGIILGSSINIDKIFEFGEGQINKYLMGGLGLYNSGYGLSGGVEIIYNLKSFPIYFSISNKLYLIPISETYSYWVSAGIGLGVQLDRIMSK